ncbi:MAG: ABC transporter permease [Bacteroidota bacterium]|nr:ABC transporter permease [Bacteroidota bacterium]
MFKNYFKTAWRNLKAHRLFTLLNIAGLSLGLAISVLLYLFIIHELSFDKMYKNEANIYRVITKSETYGNMANAPNAVAPSLVNNLPEVKYATRLLKHDFGTNAFIKVNNDDFIEKSFYWCDSSFFKVFAVPFIEGNPATALSRPNTVVISESTAKKYFGKNSGDYRDVIGKTIVIDNDKTLAVTGVFKDFPENSTLDCNLIGSYSSTHFSKTLSWSNASFETYCVLNNDASVANVEKKINGLLDKNVPKDEQWFTLSLQPLNKVHLYSAGYSDSYSSRTGDIKEVRNLALLVLLILVIACINYMNLATARSQKRAKEVAINKTLGASMRNLVFRFYAETALLTLFALFAGLVLALLTLPLFNQITGKSLSIGDLNNLTFLGGLAFMWIGITLLSGSYPALYLSRFSPKLALQQAAPKGTMASLIRKGLVVVQFASSVILIIGVIVIFKQMEYVRNKNLGYNPENVIAINTGAAKSKQQIEVLSNELESRENVLSVSGAQGFPGMGVSGRAIYKSEDDKQGLNIGTNHTSNGVIKVLQLKLLAGTDLPKVKAEGDSTVQVILNKKAVDYLGFNPQQAIGKKVKMQLGDNAFITGVIDNFNFASLHEPMGAYAFNNGDMEPEKYLLVRFKTGNLPATINEFQKLFKESIPDSVFDYTFLDKYLNTLYAAEQKMQTVIFIFSLLAIIVACMGLFGLAAYTAEQRTKEIGIRKVLGASVRGIAALLSKDFLRLVIVSIIIATPVAWWMMNKWLGDFAYRINISWWIFFVAGITAIIIALITISFQSIKTAVANPVKSLRTE